jgi:hypothetical protein
MKFFCDFHFSGVHAVLFFFLEKNPTPLKGPAKTLFKGKLSSRNV